MYFPPYFEFSLPNKKLHLLNNTSRKFWLEEGFVFIQCELYERRRKMIAGKLQTKREMEKHLCQSSSIIFMA